MKSSLSSLRIDPHERLRALLCNVSPSNAIRSISLSIRETNHPFTPMPVTTDTKQMATCIATHGIPALREAIARWCERRFNVPAGLLDPNRHILPVNDAREALLSFMQIMVGRELDSIVLSPNPFPQIYENAIILNGATPLHFSCLSQDQFVPDFDSVDANAWRACKILLLSTPSDPTGAVIGLDNLNRLISLADEYDFLILSDERSSEIYLDNATPPPGLLTACAELGRTTFKRCVVLNDLTIRSSPLGLRSGFIAGDAEVLKELSSYHTYNTCTMPADVQLASTDAWSDDSHVRSVRDLHRAKLDAVLAILAPVLDVERPAGGLFLWAKVTIDDTVFSKYLYEQTGVIVVPGSYLSRMVDGIDPGSGWICMSLVATLSDCVVAAKRIRDFVIENRTYEI